MQEAKGEAKHDWKHKSNGGDIHSIQEYPRDNGYTHQVETIAQSRYPGPGGRIGDQIEVGDVERSWTRQCEGKKATEMMGKSAKWMGHTRVIMYSCGYLIPVPLPTPRLLLYCVRPITPVLRDLTCP